PVYAVKFSADGKQVFSAGRDKKIHLWNTADAKKTGEIGGFEDEIYALLLADGKLFSAAADKLVREYAWESRQLTRTFVGHGERVYSLAWRESSHRLASGSHDGEIRLWDTATGQLVQAFKATPGLQSQH